MAASRPKFRREKPRFTNSFFCCWVRPMFMKTPLVLIYWRLRFCFLVSRPLRKVSIRTVPNIGTARNQERPSRLTGA